MMAFADAIIPLSHPYYDIMSHVNAERGGDDPKLRSAPDHNFEPTWRKTGGVWYVTWKYCAHLVEFDD